MVAPFGYSVPHDIAELLDFVGGVTRLPPVRRSKRLAATAAAGADGTNPGSLRSLYKIGTASASGVGGGVQAVVSFLGDAIRYERYSPPRLCLEHPKVSCVCVRMLYYSTLEYP